MLEAQTRERLRALVGDWRRAGQTIALVPTMGNLHAGHLALVEAARGAAERVVSSIYVNPTQFGVGEDFDRYPRTPEADHRALEAEGCDLVFAPGHDTMYPGGLENAVRVLAPPELANVLEGAVRPGHFDGVVTVVARLFNLVRPDVAVFGEKDYQQLLVIRRMTRDLGYGIRILAVPTVRENQGLAMSSRNEYLDPEQRTAAGQLSAVLFTAAERLAKEDTDSSGVERSARDELEARGFEVDYVAVRGAEGLEEAPSSDQPLRILAAVRIGGTRLIDNVPVNRVCNSEN
jgi:pantoate--beta-alanine ligase